MLYQHGNLAVRMMKKSDRFILAKWLSDPTVLEFYEGRDKPFSIEKVDEKFFGKNDDVSDCIVEYDGIEIGYIQFYPLGKEERKLYGYASETSYGMDQFIGETAYWGQGIGTALVKSMVHYLIEEKITRRVVMDPQLRNERALRCYEKCRFKKVKLLLNHELHEGVYEDCWLIEYNVGEF